MTYISYEIMSNQHIYILYSIVISMVYKEDDNKKEHNKKEYDNDTPIQSTMGYILGHLGIRHIVTEKGISCPCHSVTQEKNGEITIKTKKLSKIKILKNTGFYVVYMGFYTPYFLVKMRNSKNPYFAQQQQKGVILS